MDAAALGEQARRVGEFGLRYGPVLILVLIGGTRFTAYEAADALSSSHRSSSPATYDRTDAAHSGPSAPGTAS